WRRRADRNRIRVARHRALDVRRTAAARLSVAAGHLSRHVGNGGGVQPADRPALPDDRPAHCGGLPGGLGMKAFLKRYMRNYGAVAGLLVMLVVVAIALAAPLLYPESPWMMVAEPLIKPFADPAYPFGTDMLGRDITAGLVWGARVSLLVGLLSTGVA